MERFIGLDVHVSSSTFGVMGPSGRRLRSQVVETNGQALVGFLRTTPGTLRLCIEEGTQAAWLAEILSPHVEQLVVVGLGKVTKRSPKDDRRDAFALADMLRKGDLETVVYKNIGPYAQLRQLVKVHSQIVRDVVRTQNRIRAQFRSRGVGPLDKTVYSPRHRQVIIERLPRSIVPAAQHLYAQYDALVPVKTSAEKDMLAEARRHAISRMLQTCPGFGPIRVAQLMAIVVNPERFRRRQQFWSYCGLGIVMRSSSDWAQLPNGAWNRVTVNATRGLTRSYNRMLKAVFKGAATTVITHSSGDGPLRDYYQRQLAAGTKPNLAKLSLARKLAATILAMWKRKEPFDPGRISPA